jgi:hypothetical protein
MRHVCDASARRIAVSKFLTFAQPLLAVALWNEGFGVALIEALKVVLELGVGGFDELGFSSKTGVRSERDGTVTLLTGERPVRQQSARCFGRSEFSLTLF